MKKDFLRLMVATCLLNTSIGYAMDGEEEKVSRGAFRSLAQPMPTGTKKPVTIYSFDYRDRVEIDFQHHFPSADHLSALGQELKEARSKDIKVKNCPLDYFLVPGLLTVLPKDINSLDFSESGITNDQIAYLSIDKIKDFENLKTLKLSNIHLDETVKKYLFYTFSSESSKLDLTTLSLSKVSIKDSDIQEKSFQDFLSNQKMLRILDLSHNPGITGASVDCLTKALKGCPKLKWFWLQETGVTEMEKGRLERSLPSRPRVSS